MRSSAVRRATKNRTLSSVTSNGSGKLEEAFPAGTIQAQLMELRRAVPRRIWTKVPRDGAANIDHYLYGAPRKS